MKKCVIVGGAPCDDIKKAARLIDKDDFLIYCDCGLRYIEQIGRSPNLVIGDFDSYENPELPCETIVLPCEKDDTDTVFAAKEGLSRGFKEFLLIGAVGGRMDHTLANISILLMLEKAGAHGIIADDCAVMEFITAQAKEAKKIKDDCRYFSLLNITGRAEGITIKNAKYPLLNGKITCDYQYGVSNEVLPEKTAEVSVKKGELLLIKILN